MALNTTSNNPVTKRTSSLRASESGVLKAILKGVLKVSSKVSSKCPQSVFKVSRFTKRTVDNTDIVCTIQNQKHKKKTRIQLRFWTVEVLLALQLEHLADAVAASGSKRPATVPTKSATS